MYDYSSENIVLKVDEYKVNHWRMYTLNGKEKHKNE